MAFLYQPSLIPAFDSNGRIVSGAKLHFYLSQTLHPAPTFTDHKEWAHHTNPVIADSAGRFPPIYLAEKTIYRARMTNPAGVLLRGYDIDPINAYDPIAPVVRYYRFGGFATITPHAGEVLVEHIVTDDFVLPAMLAGSIAEAGNPPAADYVITVKRNASVVASITIDDNGNASYSTPDNEPVEIERGDVFSFHAPAEVDHAISNIRFTLKGVL